MRKVIEILNKMKDDGIISGYAVGGAMGVMFYTEPFYSDDFDVFVIPKVYPSGLVSFEHIYDYLKKKGYKFTKHLIMIEGILVDFIPISKLTEEAYNTAVMKEYESMRVKVFKPEYLLAIAIDVGRLKDIAKASMLLTQTKLDRNLLDYILKRYNLEDKFNKFLSEHDI